jgi:DNA relaxase NicK
MCLHLPQVFVPKVAPADTHAPAMWKSPMFRGASILITQVLGWPLYLMFNVGGRFYERCVYLRMFKCVCCRRDEEEL